MQTTEEIRAHGKALNAGVIEAAEALLYSVKETQDPLVLAECIALRKDLDQHPEKIYNKITPLEQRFLNAPYPKNEDDRSPYEAAKTLSALRATLHEFVSVHVPNKLKDNVQLGLFSTSIVFGILAMAFPELFGTFVMGGSAAALGGIVLPTFLPQQNNFSASQELKVTLTYHSESLTKVITGLHADTKIKPSVSSEKQQTKTSEAGLGSNEAIKTDADVDENNDQNTPPTP
ncbi:MAG: hypothetical protein ACOYKA_07185 [Legionellaceae bacterium]